MTAIFTAVTVILAGCLLADIAGGDYQLAVLDGVGTAVFGTTLILWITKIRKMK